MEILHASMVHRAWRPDEAAVYRFNACAVASRLNRVGTAVSADTFDSPGYESRGCDPHFSACDFASGSVLAGQKQLIHGPLANHSKVAVHGAPAIISANDPK